MTQGTRTKVSVPRHLAYGMPVSLSIAQTTGRCATMHSGGQRFDAFTEFGDSAVLERRSESDMADAR